MTLPILFAAVTAATGAQLDQNFEAVGLLGVIPCAVLGTNTLTLTPAAQATPTVGAYQNYMVFSGIAAHANTGAVTAAVAGLAALGVYKDTGAGPAALAGGEIQPGNLILLLYDTALNAGAGGFHLQTAGVTAAGTVTSVASGTGLTGGPITATGTLALAASANLRIKSNISGGAAAPIDNTLSAILDAILGTTAYRTIQRGASLWAAVGGVALGVAAAGNSQGTATVLSAQYNELTTVNAATGVVIPATIGLTTYIFQRGANTLAVYPPSGGQIDAAGLNASVSLLSGATGRYTMVSATQGYSS